MTTVRGGRGGDGMVSFMHLKYNEWAGPDGGDGGDGGSVVFQADSNITSLNRLQSIYQADHGENGASCHMRGKNGRTLVVGVPIGTTFMDMNGQVLACLKQNEKKYIAAHGGPGGKGNAYFLANDNREPRQFETGKPGQENTVQVQLNIIADAVLVLTQNLIKFNFKFALFLKLGFPNVGKSSMLKAMSNARPKIGDYSFTTLHPHVGMVQYEDHAQIAVADFPGILPDLTRGFGTKFFHHLNECKIFVFVVDVADRSADPYDQFKSIRDAVDFYNPDIWNGKKVLVVANKVDLLTDESDLKERIQALRLKTDLPVIPLSVKKKINLKKFLSVLRDVYETN